MILQSVSQKCFCFGGLKPVVVENSEAALTSDAGLIPIRQFDEIIGLSERYPGVLNDPH